MQLTVDDDDDDDVVRVPCVYVQRAQLLLKTRRSLNIFCMQAQAPLNRRDIFS
jgi:hypothetical protein